MQEGKRDNGGNRYNGGKMEMEGSSIIKIARENLNAAICKAEIS